MACWSFGTPTLLLLGFPFEQVLGYLLPCSISISALQIAESGGFKLDPVRRRFLLFTAPAVVLATSVVILRAKIDIKPEVGAMLVLTAGLRAFAVPRRWLASRVGDHQPVLFTALGLLHGLTNLGGGLLTVLMAALHGTKEGTRRQVAFAYGTMASLQLLTLAIVGRPGLEPLVALTLPPLAITVSWVIGRRVYRAASQHAYQWALTMFLLSYGMVLIAQR